METQVSTIIIGYNYGRFLAGAIESVLQQTRRPEEIIVVDDGSTDDTAAVAARYAGAGVRYLYQPNKGVSAARNLGAGASHGAFLTFLDSDDRWLPDKIERQLAHLARYPAAGWVTGSEWQVTETGGDPFYVRRPAQGAGWIYPDILVENSVGNASLVLVRRAVFEQAEGFDEGVGLGQDWDLWIRLARLAPLGVVAGPLIYYTRHAGSLSAGRVDARFHSNRAFQRRYIAPLPHPWRRLNLLRRAQSMNYYYAAASLAHDAARHGPARGPALAAWLLDPFYKPRLKAGVLLRAWGGPAAFTLLRRLRSRRPAAGLLPPVAAPPHQEDGRGTRDPAASSLIFN